MLKRFLKSPAIPLMALCASWFFCGWAWRGAHEPACIVPHEPAILHDDYKFTPPAMSAGNSISCLYLPATKTYVCDIEGHAVTYNVDVTQPPIVVVPGR